MIRLDIPAGQDGNGLLACITQMLPGVKTGDAKKLLKKGDVKVNGTRIKKDMPVSGGRHTGNLPAGQNHTVSQTGDRL